MNIPKYTEQYAKELRRRNFSENTIKNYVSCIALFLSKMTKEHPLHVNESDIKEYLGGFSEPNTQRSSHSAIKRFYEICFGQKEKFKFIPYCKKSNKLPIVLSPEEVQRMFNVCTNLKHRAIFALLYACGLRVSEVVNLKITSVDSSRMVINILQAKGKKDRQVMLPESLLKFLRAYFKEYKPKEYLFNGQNSLQYSEKSINEFLKAIAVKAKVDNKRIYAHLIRHCTFTHMLENGVDLTVIQKIAGHSSIKTTQGVAVYFNYNGEPVVFCCDKWHSVAANMQAVYKSIEAIRGLDRWGVSDMLKRVFTGLPQGDSSEWFEVLGVRETANVEEAKAAYRALTLLHHPDRGGNQEEYIRVTEAYQKFQSINGSN